MEKFAKSGHTARWLDYFFNIWQFTTMIMCPKYIKFTKFLFKILPNTKWTLSEWPKLFNIMPNVVTLDPLREKGVHNHIIKSHERSQWKELPHLLEVAYEIKMSCCKEFSIFNTKRISNHSVMNPLGSGGLLDKSYIVLGTFTNIRFRQSFELPFVSESGLHNQFHD